MRCAVGKSHVCRPIPGRRGARGLVRDRGYDAAAAMCARLTRSAGGL